MTQNQIEKSITTGRLQLSAYHMLSHYAIVLISLAYIVVFLYILSEKQILSKPLPPKEELFFFFGSILSAVFFTWLQAKRLRFIKIARSFPTDETLAITESTVSRLGWKVSSKGYNYIVAKVFNGWMAGSWGEQVTVIINNDGIYINSICDPDKKTSLASYGNNRKNVEKLLNEMKTIAKEQSLLTKS